MKNAAYKVQPPRMPSFFSRTVGRVKDFCEKHHLAFFLAPAMIVLISFAAYITIMLVYLSLSEWNFSSPSPTLIGFDNFIRIASDREFWEGLLKSVVFLVATVTGEIVVGFFVAYLLNRKIRGLGLIRTLIIVPMAITPVVVGMFWKILYDPTLGPINYFLSLVGIEGPQWLSSGNMAFLSIVLVNIWEWAPFSFLVITAGMSALPNDVYEACKIDGASAFQTLVGVTIPMLKQVLLTLVLLRSIEALKAFDLIFVMTRGGPGDATQLLPYYIYLNGFNYFDFGYAAALAVLMLVIVNAFFTIFTSKAGVNVFYEND